MSRIKLESGAGRLGVIYDVAEDRLHPYTVDSEIHARYGGRMYYRSRSGLSCAGWMPASPELLPLPTYRVDTIHPKKLTEDTPPVFGGVRLVVPINYRARAVATSAPAIGWTTWGEFWLGPTSSLRPMIRAMLQGQVPDGWSRRSAEWTCYGSDGIAVTSSAELITCDSLGRSVVAAGEWALQRSLSPSFEDVGLAVDFFHRLGLRLTNTGLFKVRGGIATEYIPSADVTLRSIHQRASQAVEWISGFAYVAKDGPTYYVHWLDVVEGAIVGHGCHNLSDIDAFNLLAGTAPSEVLAEYRDSTWPVTPPFSLCRRDDPTPDVVPD